MHDAVHMSVREGSGNVAEHNQRVGEVHSTAAGQTRPECAPIDGRRGPEKEISSQSRIRDRQNVRMLQASRGENRLARRMPRAEKTGGDGPYFHLPAGSVLPRKRRDTGRMNKLALQYVLVTKPSASVFHVFRFSHRRKTRPDRRKLRLDRSELGRDGKARCARRAGGDVVVVVCCRVVVRIGDVLDVELRTKAMRDLGVKPSIEPGKRRDDDLVVDCSEHLRLPHDTERYTETRGYRVLVPERHGGDRDEGHPRTGRTDCRCVDDPRTLASESAGKLPRRGDVSTCRHLETLTSLAPRLDRERGIG